MVVVTFHTTQEAFAFEAAAASAFLPGKLGVTPRSLSADCGFSWQAPDECKADLEILIADARLTCAGVHMI